MDVFAEAARLRGLGARFALATVVRAERPTSARSGAKAIVHPDGTVAGFVGGSCVRPAVRREALRAIADGAPRLLRIAPASAGRGAEPAPEGVLEEPMACVSGGALDIHIEPHLPPPRLLVVGESPVAAALETLGAGLGMEVRSAPGGSETPDGDGKGEEGGLAESCRDAFVVVAAHGEGEWEALETALSGGRARYVGLVASPRRAAAVRQRLAAKGVAEGDLARLVSPAGLDLGAREPAEIALSILAQIVEERRRPAEAGADERPDDAEPARTSAPTTDPVGIATTLPESPLPVDPVCGMSVSPDTPHRRERDGEMFFFCCAGCAETFAGASR